FLVSFPTSPLFPYTTLFRSIRTTRDLGDFVFVPLDQIIQLALHPLQFDHVPIVASLIHQLTHLVEAHLRLRDAAFQLLELSVHVRSLWLTRRSVAPSPKSSHLETFLRSTDRSPRATERRVSGMKTPPSTSHRG